LPDKGERMQAVMAGEGERNGERNKGGAPRKPGLPIDEMRQRAEYARPVLTVRHAAHLAGVTQQAIRKAISQGQLKATPVIGESGERFGYEIRLVDLFEYYGIELD
jgi:hypothetical protein